jgi:SP family sugar:H+ symporter-like MFS transporter
MVCRSSAALFAVLTCPPSVLGRRGGLITASTIFGIGALIQTAVTNIAGLVAGRVITGAGVGLISMMVPMMQAEVAPAHIRGSLVAFYQLSITIGILVAQGVDLGTANLTSSAAWVRPPHFLDSTRLLILFPQRVPIGLQMLWSLIIIVGCLAIPESPRFLVTRGKVDEARASLARRKYLPTKFTG